MNDERLRQLYSRGMAGHDARSELMGACPIAPERMLALVRCELPEAEQLELLDEVMSSSACREAFELLRVVEAVNRVGGGSPLARDGEREGIAVDDLGTTGMVKYDNPDATVSAADGRTPLSLLNNPAAQQPVDGAGGRADRAAQTGPWWRRNGASMVLAASALIAVGLFAWDRSGGGPEVTRGAGDGVTLLAPATQPEAGNDAPNFVWRAVTSATVYEFELLDATGEPVHEASTSDTVMAWPADVPLLPGVEYRWLIRARTPVGLRSSPARQLRIPAR